MSEPMWPEFIDEPAGDQIVEDLTNGVTSSGTPPPPDTAYDEPPPQYEDVSPVFPSGDQTPITSDPVRATSLPPPVDSDDEETYDEDLKQPEEAVVNHTPIGSDQFRQIYAPRETLVRHHLSQDEIGTPRTRGQIVMNSELPPDARIQDVNTEDLLQKVAFTPLLRQVDIGIELMDHMKEVVRKFSKHQSADANKLLEIYQKLPPAYKKMEGMREFAQIFELTYSLIIETVKAQKRLSDFLGSSIVPSMTKYIQDKQQKVQQIKRNNQQAEIKLNTTVTAMKKQATSAQTAARRAKAADPVVTRPAAKMAQQKKGGWKGWSKKIASTFQNEKDANLTEGELLYRKAQQEDEKYRASVMTTNHEQGVYFKIVDRFKRECNQVEVDRMKFVLDQVSQLVKRHRQMFSNEKIVMLQTQLASAVESLDTKREFNLFLDQIVKTQGPWTPPSQYEYKRPDFQNIFYSLQDAMDVTKQLDSSATVPKIMTTMCERIIELNGFTQEGIFRISAATTDLDELRQSLLNNKYTVKSNDAHVPAGMLKEWLRGLNDSLIPKSHYEICISMAKNPEKITNETLEVFLSQLSEVNRASIRYLVGFLKKLLEPSNIEKTKMNAENVSIVFAPTILKCPSDDPQVLMLNSKYEKDFVIRLIQNLIV